MPQCADCGVLTRERLRTLTSFDRCGEPPTVKAGLALAVSLTLEPSSRVTADRGEPLLHAAVAGMGIVLPPLEVFRSALDDGRLVELLPSCRAPSKPLHLIYATDRRVTTKLRSFIHFAVEECRQRPDTR
ncbi:MAG: hypothetical protein KKG12_04775 [Gammaproteobacteria bacterium]|nr:hypothetical protein [Gammaproteobacteria bacterium]